MKAFSEISPVDLRDHPVWEFVNDARSSEICLRAFDHLPINDFGNRVVGTVAILANGNHVTAMLQNVDLNNPHRTAHLATLTVFNDTGDSFPLARYHDIAVDTHGPAQLAAFLGLQLDDVFPISYDISDVATGDQMSVCRKIPIRPKQLLSPSEIIGMALE